MARILVTGGAGMIGSNLVKRLISRGDDVVVIDNLWRGRLENLLNSDMSPSINLDHNFHNIDLSLGLPDQLMEGIDYVYHLADIVAGVDWIFKNQGSVFRMNMQINSNVINAARNSKIKGFVYVGTACSFPEHLQSSDAAYPLKEEEQYPAQPESAYGWSKLMGEYESILLEKETGIPVSILVLHNVYGAPCDLGVLRSQVIPSLIAKAVCYPDVEFEVWGSGRQGRAFIHVDDVVSALLNTIPNGFGHGAIQIGPNRCTTINDLAHEIIKISGKQIEIKYDNTKPEGDRSRCADYSKATRILGWEPSVSLANGLSRLYDWVEFKLNKSSN